MHTTSYAKNLYNDSETALGFDDRHPQGLLLQGLVRGVGPDLYAVYDKLQVNSKTEAVLKAMREGLVK